MGKFIYALLSIFIVEAAMLLYVNPNPAPVDAIGFSESNHTILYDFITAPSTSSKFYSEISIAIGGLTLAAIVASLFVSINVYVLYVAIALFGLSFTMVAAQLSNFVYSAMPFLDDATRILVAGIVFAIFGIYYVIALIEWVRFN